MWAVGLLQDLKFKTKTHSLFRNMINLECLVFLISNIFLSPPKPSLSPPWEMGRFIFYSHGDSYACRINCDKKNICLWWKKYESKSLLNEKIEKTACSTTYTYECYNIKNSKNKRKLILKVFLHFSRKASLTTSMYLHLQNQALNLIFLGF